MRQPPRPNPPGHRAWPALAAIAIALPAVSTAAAGAEDDDRTQLAERLAAVEHRIEALAGGPALRAADAQRAAEMKALVREIVHDAGQRTSWRQGGAVAGYDGGFFIASGDGAFRLNIGGQLQVRWVTNHQDDGPDDDDRSGFENSRTRLGFGGHVIDPSWAYFLWTGWTGNGSTILLDAWIAKRLDDGWSVRVGQFKLPTWREWSVSETRQQFVERSIVDARYAQGYSQGVLACREGDDVRLHLAFSDGLRTMGTPWETGPDVETGALPYPQSTEYAFSARAEWRLAGAWSQYGDFVSFPGEAPMSVLGAAVHYQDGEYGTDDDEAAILQWTVDGAFEFGGLSVHAAVIGTSVDRDADDRDEIGAVVQAGLFLVDHWELIGRYEYGDNDGAGVFEDTLSILTVGLNRYFRKHTVKWTTDCGYAFEAVDPSWASPGRGFRRDEDGADDQVVVRTQLQLLF